MRWNEPCILYTYTHIHTVIKQYYKLCVRTGVDTLKYFIAITDTAHIYTLEELERMNLIFWCWDDYMFQMVLNLMCLQYQIKETGLDKACAFIYVLHRLRLHYKQSSF